MFQSLIKDLGRILVVIQFRYTGPKAIWLYLPRHPSVCVGVCVYATSKLCLIFLNRKVSLLTCRYRSCLGTIILFDISYLFRNNGIYIQLGILTFKMSNI